MAKIALLIGITDYQEGLESPDTQADMQEMQRVLQKPEVGDFDVVELLLNPDATQMQLAIEKLFQNRSSDDLILLYFSGHVVKDDNGTLYLATFYTQKPQKGRVFTTSTEVPASFIQNCMNSSFSKQQVLILDCCFSSAFCNDKKAKQADEAVDIKAQLGGEGRAVLTSSAAIQFSYEKEESGIYTRYLIEGLETGAADRNGTKAADRNGDGKIFVDELHEYATKRVQASAPAIQPEIYASEGDKILLARSPKGDAKLIYRKNLQASIESKNGKFLQYESFWLKYPPGTRVGMSSNKQICQEVWQPYEAFWAKMQVVEQALIEMLEYDPQISTASLDDLHYLQRVLKLRDEDVQLILDAYGSGCSSPPLTTPTAQSSTLPKVVVTPSPQNLEDDLSSEIGIDYTRLRDLLKAGDWSGADLATYLIMTRAMSEKVFDLDLAATHLRIGAISEEDLPLNLRDLWYLEPLSFPCADLKTIDRLWTKYSNGRFGFSVQKKIYLEWGGKPYCSLYSDDEVWWHQFCDRVGWRKNNEWVEYYYFCFDSAKAPTGHLPILFNSRPSDCGTFELRRLNLSFDALVLRLLQCRL
ncbi:GUN4 domain-containing protein [Trichocoleus sp. FACHB-591]|uniref:GUN4 domain-containing protein n=1 Tax=Trichocoleus sp. FACHB-591 TaxID=2692872 RepID=UPI001682DC9C|nr:GUN4 domain-containing protein [Trichocoleus sp. FACHB-591]MBD2096954.1 GUN4 domain-containing protein [Trichocoleus sp. FACHB-591]